MSRLADLDRIRAPDGGELRILGAGGGPILVGLGNASAPAFNVSALTSGPDLVFGGRGAVTVPVGDSTNRPPSPAGTIRFHDVYGRLEVLTAGGWRRVGPAAPTAAPAGFSTIGSIMVSSVPLSGNRVSIGGLAARMEFEILIVDMSINSPGWIDIEFYDSGGTQFTSLRNYTSSFQSNGVEDGWFVDSGNPNALRLAEAGNIDPTVPFTVIMGFSNSEAGDRVCTGVVDMAQEDPNTGTWSLGEGWVAFGGGPVDRIDLVSNRNFSSGTFRVIAI